jgi:hydroxymethylbilane synthase
MEGQLPLVRAEGEACVRTLDEADALGLAVAARLRAAGAVAAC